MSKVDFLGRISSLFKDRGGSLYGGEAVTQLEHGLQAAYLAEQAGDPTSLITASLLHDVGHLLHGHGDDCAERGLDDKHEDLGVRFLTRHFPPAVTEPVRLHVNAKRYLCHVESTYHDTLSPPSQLSLRLQGGPMTADEAAEFEKNPFYRDAVKLRRYDDTAKAVGLPTPDFAHFVPYLENALACD